MASERGEARGERRTRRSLTSVVSHSTLSLCLSAFLFSRLPFLFESDTSTEYFILNSSKPEFDLTLSNLITQMYGLSDSKLHDSHVSQAKFRPHRIRYRNDAAIFNSRHSEAPYYPSRMAYPLLTDHLPSFGWSTNASASTVRVPDPSLEDCELIDVLWRRDIDVEKGEGLLSVGPAEQYELDLQLLTEKSIHQALSAEEQRTFEDISRGFFHNFYHKKEYCRTSECESESAYSSSSKFGQPACWKSEASGKLCESNRKANDEGVGPSQNAFYLNTSSGVIDDPILNNVSLSLAAGFNASNVTDSVIAPVFVAQEGDVVARGRIASESDEPLSLSGSASLPRSQSSPIATPTLALNDSESSFWFSDAQVQQDVSQSFIDRDAMHESSAAARGSTLEGAAGTPSIPHFAPPSPSFGAIFHSTRRSASSAMSNANGRFVDRPASSSSSSSSAAEWYGSELSASSACASTVPSSRLYGKLLPSMDDTLSELVSRPSRSSAFQTSRSGPATKTTTGNLVRRRGRQSKDEMLVEEYGLPASAAQISDMSLSDLQKLMRRDSLDDVQRALIRKIRRRGKNKLAARTCRQRRTEIASSTATSYENQPRENAFNEPVEHDHEKSSGRRRVVLGGGNVFKK